jgi:hypothetical protein
MKVCIGFTFGRTAKTVSPIKPLEDEASPAASIVKKRVGTKFRRATVSPVIVSIWLVKIVKDTSQNNSTRSTAAHSAHTFGAQYAWQSPRLKGNNRDNTCRR